MLLKAVRKGDGHPHLTYKARPICGRTLRANRWAKIRYYDSQIAMRLIESTIRRPYTMDAVCGHCMKTLYPHGVPATQDAAS